MIKIGYEEEEWKVVKNFKKVEDDVYEISNYGNIRFINSDERVTIKIANKTMRVVKTNIILSIALKVLVMILALIIKLPMFVAIIADVGVCLLAILNSLTIMYGKIK